MRLLRRLDRYVIGEILGPLFLGFLVYTFIVLAQFLLQSAEMIVRRGVPAPMVGKLLLLSLPNIVVITIPMSFLFAILVAVGRLSADNELVAMRSSGVSLMSLYRPVFILSVVLTVFNTYLMLDLLPAGNHALQRLRIEIVTQSINKQVEPRVFYDEWPGFMLYVWESPPGDTEWEGVFLAERKPGEDAQLTIAQRGQIEVDSSGERVVLNLRDAVTHKVNLDQPEKYHIIKHDTFSRLVEERFGSNQRAKVKASKGLREKTVPELKADLANPDFPPELANLARVEIHKKYSLPAACLVFGLIGLPMGFNTRRGSSKSSSFALSLVIILLYWVMITNGEEAARVGKMAPWLAMWLPNIVFAVLGLYLLVRRNRDKSLVLRDIDHWMQARIWGPLRQFQERRQAKVLTKGRASANHSIEGAEESPSSTVPVTPAAPTGTRRTVIRLPRFRPWLPSLIDRYIAKIFGRIGLLVMTSMVLVFVVADLTNIADDLLTNDVPGQTIFRYYRYLSLQIIYELSPVVTLVTTLVAFGLLSRTNEITACKATGTSLYRISLPAIFCATVLALGCFYLQAEVLPTTNRKVARMKDKIKGRDTPRIYRRADRQWLFGQGRFIYNFQAYSPDAQSITRLQVAEFNDDLEMVRRLYVSEANYMGEGRWRFESGWTRRFDGNQVAEFKPFDEPVLGRFPETPEYFESDLKPPDQMSYRELKAYIKELQASGQSVPDMQTQLFAKVAYPTAGIVMALVALPFAFRLGRKGALYGLGISVVLGMVFVAISHFFTTLGETGALPPLIAVWSPNIAFAFLSVYLFLGVRT